MTAVCALAWLGSSCRSSQLSHARSLARLCSALVPWWCTSCPPACLPACLLQMPIQAKQTQKGIHLERELCLCSEPGALSRPSWAQCVYLSVSQSVSQSFVSVASALGTQHCGQSFSTFSPPRLPSVHKREARQSEAQNQPALYSHTRAHRSREAEQRYVFPDAAHRPVASVLLSSVQWPVATPTPALLDFMTLDSLSIRLCNLFALNTVSVPFNPQLKPPRPSAPVSVVACDYLRYLPTYLPSTRRGSVSPSHLLIAASTAFISFLGSPVSLAGTAFFGEGFVIAQDAKGSNGNFQHFRNPTDRRRLALCFLCLGLHLSPTTHPSHLVFVSLSFPILGIPVFPTNRHPITKRSLSRLILLFSALPGFSISTTTLPDRCSIE
ncbi:hypothetical protein LX32DRAFT_271088 [Colletotrichum zoysiae]|uniref:Uncharacterized protein n=1 Tax=Colletotrichum zoysiae TaxID=1216348 RepID=A0AAD9H312_9PEZI|nr:hypothetical protein LX32DRAFT_271088 [Colletotrichum zoysiae]